MMEIMVQKDALEYILLQRTQYQKLWNNKVLRSMLQPFLSYNRIVKLEASFFPRRIVRQFRDDMKTEYEILRKYLPQDINTILDIGCGVAGIDVLLDKHYNDKKPDIFLLDKSNINEMIHYGYEKTASFYSSLAIARSLLEENGVDGSRIHLQEVNDESSIDFEKKFDIVISLISWGFHYPVSTYLDRVYELMNDQGILIIDVRDDSEGYDEIKAKFGNIKKIFKGPKCNRIVAKKILDP